MNFLQFFNKKRSNGYTWTLFYVASIINRKLNDFMISLIRCSLVLKWISEFKAVGGQHQWRWTEPSSLATEQFCIVFNLFLAQNKDMFLTS